MALRLAAESSPASATTTRSSTSGWEVRKRVMTGMRVFVSAAFPGNM